MRNLIVALSMGVCASLMGSTGTLAQFLVPGIAGVVGTCSHSLNFSQACNSQYIIMGII